MYKCNSLLFHWMCLHYMWEAKEALKIWQFLFCVIFCCLCYSAEAIKYMVSIFHLVTRIWGKKILPLTGDARSISTCKVLFAIKWALLKHAFPLCQETDIGFVFVCIIKILLPVLFLTFFSSECCIHWGLENPRVSCLSDCPLPLISFIGHSYYCPAHLCRNQPFLFGPPSAIHKDSREKYCSACRRNREEIDAAAWISHVPVIPRCWVW